MSDAEFDLIRVFLDALPDNVRGDEGVVVGPGDDAAVLDLPEGQQWVLSTDALVEGRHFPAGLPPRLLGHRALAVNLSDLAAMGAAPHGVLLALTAPRLDAAWLAALAAGFGDAAGETGARMVGGNLAAGPLNLALTVTGTVPAGRALRRGGAAPGDVLCVSGRIGAGAAALAALARHDVATLDADAVPEELDAYVRPQARIALGLALRDVASACIDVSDGLVADVGHLCSASGVQARIVLERVPTVGDPIAAVTAGDDYELAFTLPASAESELAAIAEAAGVEVHRIGRVVAPEDDDAPVLLLDGDGETIDVPTPGWDHFR